MWKPGQSGNPSGGPGRPPLTREAREAQRLAMDLSLSAMQRLGGMLDHPDPQIVLAASRIILDRGLGKPAQQVDLRHEDGGADGITPADARRVMRELFGDVVPSNEGPSPAATPSA